MYIGAASLHLREEEEGEEERDDWLADSAAGDEVRSFKALIASGKRSHFPNHIRAPIIYFLPPAPALLCLSHSLSLALTHSISLRSAVAASLSAFASVCLCSEFPAS